VLNANVTEYFISDGLGANALKLFASRPNFSATVMLIPLNMIFISLDELLQKFYIHQKGVNNIR
jgi:hypothetical protein